MKFLISLMMLSLTFSAFADVKIIKSKINGIAVRTIGKTVNVISPTIKVDGEKMSLDANRSTAEVACQMLGMELISFDGKHLKSWSNLVQLTEEDGSLNFLQGSVAMSVLTCRELK